MPRLTKIEALDLEHPGLRQHVDLRLDGRARQAVIVRELEQKFGVRVVQPAISSYKTLRWMPGKESIRQAVEGAEEIVGMLGEHGDSNLSRALVAQQLVAAQAGRGMMRPEALLREQRQQAKLRIELERLKGEKEKLELEKGRWHEDRRQVREALESAERPGDLPQAVAAEDVLKKISAVIGVGGELEERIES